MDPMSALPCLPPAPAGNAPLKAGYPVYLADLSDPTGYPSFYLEKQLWPLACSLKEEVTCPICLDYF